MENSQYYDPNNPNRFIPDREDYVYGDTNVYLK